MNYEEILENVTVLGAAGKMGSGITLLTAMEMANLKQKPENKDKSFVLNAMDVSDKALDGLMAYIKSQATKAAEKKTVMLRQVYKERADLIENYDIIDQYVFDVMSVIRPVTKLEAAYDSNLVFEAASENPELKVKLFSQINQNSSKNPWIFTNTSSIPINELDSKAQLDGRILGFHFYNPPAVQKLVELITTDNTKQELIDFAHACAKNMRKIIVPSNDFAGFIGNGHFMRDALYAMNQVEQLRNEMSFTEAVYCMNKISQDFLIRPMGIFQLVDYVGIDVCQYIMKVMNPYLPDENLHSPLLDKMMELGVKGGQNPDGSQKDGFLKYEKGKPAAIYDPEKQEYIPVENLKESCDSKLGTLPASAKPWKAIIGNPKKEDALSAHFSELKTMNTKGAELAKQYILKSKEIGKQLVVQNVANSEEDVNTVLLTGFYHAYGPVNNYID